MLGGRVVFLLALLVDARLRVAHVLTLEKTPLFKRLVGDADRYDAWGQAIAAGDWLSGDRPFFQDPLYSYFLGVLYRLVGHDLAAVRWAQVGFAVGTCALIGMLGRQVSGPVVGNVAAWCWALFLPDIFNTGEVDKTALGLLLSTGALVCALRPSLRARAGAGVLLGLAALTRGNLLAAAPVLALGFLWPERKLWRHPRALFATAAGRGALVFCAGFALTLAPATLRNRAVSGQWVLTTTALGPTFFTGNSPWSRTGAFEALPFIRSDAAFEETDFRAEAERRTGHALNSSEVSRYWFGEGLRFVADHPLETLRRFGVKLWLLGNDFEAFDTLDMKTVALFAPVLALALPTAGFFIPLGLVGFWVSRKRQPGQLLFAHAAVLALATAAIFVLARYRVFLMPTVVVMAAVGAGWVVGAVRARRWKPLAVAGAAWGVATFASFTPPKIAEAAYVLGPLNVAALFSTVGAMDQAEALIKEATRRGPTWAPVWCAAGRLEALQHRWVEARTHARLCLSMDPNHRGAWELMGTVEVADGHFEQAAAAWRKQLELTPGDEELRKRLEALPVNGQ